MTIESSKTAKDKGRPRQISVDKIVEQAVEIGLKDLSMHKLAKSMNVSATALYRHVANKDALIALVTDLISKKVELPKVKLWDAYLYELARNYRMAALSLSGSAEFVRYVGFKTPNASIVFEDALAVLEENGFSSRDTFIAVSTIVSHACNMVAEQELFSAKNKDVGFQSSKYEHLPNVVWALQSNVNVGHEESFEIGLKIIIEGLRQSCALPQKWQPQNL